MYMCRSTFVVAATFAAEFDESIQCQQTEVPTRVDLVYPTSSKQGTKYRYHTPPRRSTSLVLDLRSVAS